LTYIALFFCFLKILFSVLFKNFYFISFSLILFYLSSHDYSVYNPTVEHPLQFLLHFSFVKRWHASVRFHPNKNLQRHTKNNVPSIEPFYHTFTLPAVCIRDLERTSSKDIRIGISNLLWEIECYISVLIRSERPAGRATYNASCSIYINRPFI